MVFCQGQRACGPWRLLISDERDEIHREFGMRICQAVGSKVARNGGGKPIKKRVKNSIIKSYTMMIAEPPALPPAEQPDQAAA